MAKNESKAHYQYQELEYPPPVVKVTSALFKGRLGNIVYSDLKTFLKDKYRPVHFFQQSLPTVNYFDGPEPKPVFSPERAQQFESSGIHTLEQYFGSNHQLGITNQELSNLKNLLHDFAIGPEVMMIARAFEYNSHPLSPQSDLELQNYLAKYFGINRNTNHQFGILLMRYGLINGRFMTTSEIGKDTQLPDPLIHSRENYALRKISNLLDLLHYIPFALNSIGRTGFNFTCVRDLERKYPKIDINQLSIAHLHLSKGALLELRRIMRIDVEKPFTRLKYLLLNAKPEMLSEKTAAEINDRLSELLLQKSR